VTAREHKTHSAPRSPAPCIRQWVTKTLLLSQETRLVYAPCLRIPLDVLSPLPPAPIQPPSAPSSSNSAGGPVRQELWDIATRSPPGKGRKTRMRAEARRHVLVSTEKRPLGKRSAFPRLGDRSSRPLWSLSISPCEPLAVLLEGSRDRSRRGTGGGPSKGRRLPCYSVSAYEHTWNIDRHRCLVIPLDWIGFDEIR